LKLTDFRSKSRHIPFAREGIPYLGASMFVTFISAILGGVFLTWVLVGVTLLIGHFFRDPGRICTADEKDLLSPADGKVIGIERIGDTPLSGKPSTRISIFMSVFDVHVNRIPASGTLQALDYRKGRFWAADRDIACRENEQNRLHITTDSGEDIVVTQVAGLIARRIVCWPTTGDRVVRGERFGMIRFGSRVDVYVPEDCDIWVTRGQYVYGGETVLCRLK
jgi:phosphatidylserine decarboxylase